MSKDSFVIVREQRPAFESLADEDAGKLIKAVLAYQFDGIEPALPPVPQMAFAMMRPVFERFAAKYAETCRKRKEAGAKGGKAKAANASKCQTGQANVANASNAKQSLHDRDRDRDPVREEKEEHTHDGSHDLYAPADSQGVRVSSAPLNGEDIEERKDAVRQEHKRGDYEFSLLRDAYDKARQEGPRAGRQEFLALFHSPEWPGIDELVHAVDVLCAEDDQFRRGYAPGLARFLANRMWRMKPRAPAGEKPPTPEDAEGKRKWEELKAKVRADKEARKKRGR